MSHLSHKFIRFLTIDRDIYEKKLDEYKKRQQEIIALMATHVDADKQA